MEKLQSGRLAPKFNSRKLKIVSRLVLANHVIVRASGCIRLPTERQQLSFDRGHSYIGCYSKSILPYTDCADKQPFSVLQRI